MNRSKLQLALFGSLSAILVGFIVFIDPLIAMLIIITVAVLLLLMFKPLANYLLVILLIHLVYISIIIRHIGVPYIYTILDSYLGLAIIIWGVSRAIKVVEPYPGCPLDSLITMFVGLVLLSLLWSQDFDIGVLQAYRFLMVILFSIVLSLSIIKDWRHMNTVIWLTIALGVIDGILCFISLYVYPEWPVLYEDTSKYYLLKIFFNIESIGKRGHGLSPPLTTAFMLGFSLFLVMGQFLVAKAKKWRSFIGVIMLFIMVALTSTLSKGPLISTVGGFMFLFTQLKPLRGKLVTASSGLVAAIIFSFVLANITDLGKTVGFTKHQFSIEEGTSISTRKEWWKTSVKKGIESYGLGVGVGGLPRHLKPFVSDPHNVYVSAFAELGFPGFLLFIGLLYKAFSYFMRAVRESKSEYCKRVTLAFIGGYVQILLALFLQFDYMNYLLWSYLGFGLVIARLALLAPSGFMDEGLPYYAKKCSIVHSKSYF